MSATALILQNVLYERKSGVAYVTLNRPKVLNALNTPTWTDLRTAFKDAKADKSVRGVILTGAGDKAFIAGADISELAHVDAFEAEESSRFGQGVLDLIENLGKPVIAAINGFALGGGCEAAMACTIRIAVEHAKFGQPEVKLGLLPGGGGTQRLPRLVGKGRALQQAQWLWSYLTGQRSSLLVAETPRGKADIKTDRAAKGRTANAF